jgi:hypothetical protein
MHRPAVATDLVLVLHPVQAQGVEEGGQGLHDHEHTQGGAGKHKEPNDHGANVVHL